jgi:hypothetical protein
MPDQEAETSQVLVETLSVWPASESTEEEVLAKIKRIAAKLITVVPPDAVLMPAAVLRTQDHYLLLGPQLVGSFDDAQQRSLFSKLAHKFNADFICTMSEAWAAHVSMSSPDLDRVMELRAQHKLEEYEGKIETLVLQFESRTKPFQIETSIVSRDAAGRRTSSPEWTAQPVTYPYPGWRMYLRHEEKQVYKS